MKKYQTTKGQTYIVTAFDKCEVKGYANKTEYLLLSLPANSQGVFVAISDEITLSDSLSVIIPFADASIALGAGGGSSAGGSRCTIEAVPAYQVTETIHGQTISYWELDTAAKSFRIIDPEGATTNLQLDLINAGTGEFLYTPLYGFRNAGDASVFLGWCVDVPASDVQIALGSLESYSEAIQSVTEGTQKLFISKYFHD